MLYSTGQFQDSVTEHTESVQQYIKTELAVCKRIAIRKTQAEHYHIHTPFAIVILTWFDVRFSKMLNLLL